MDSNGTIRIEDNMVTIFADTEDGNSVRLYCMINPKQNTIVAYNTAIMGMYCPCCNTNTFTCTSLYNKRNELLHEAYELLKVNSATRLQLLFEQVGTLNVVK